jgi:hypothetical protein
LNEPCGRKSGSPFDQTLIGQAPPFVRGQRLHLGCHAEGLFLQQLLCLEFHVEAADPLAEELLLGSVDGGDQVPQTVVGRYFQKIRGKIRSEGVTTLRNLLGAMVLKGTRFGAVVSTVDHFTYRARQAREKAELAEYTIVLNDRGKLDRMLDPLLLRHGWLELISKKRPDWAANWRGRTPNRDQMVLFGEE